MNDQDDVENVELCIDPDDKPTGRSIGIGHNRPLIDREFKEAPPLQYLRELTKNPIQAGATRVLVRPDAVHYARFGVLKTMFADDGEGMSADKLLEYADLSSTGHTFENNFGSGAKTSTLTANRLGVVFMSKTKDGTWAMTRLGLKEDGDYGIIEWTGTDEDEDGTLKHTQDDKLAVPKAYQDLHASLFPGAQSGTMVILMGCAPDEDTWLSKPGTEAHVAIRERLKYLNLRYFDQPTAPGSPKETVELWVFDEAFGDKFGQLKPHSEWPKEIGLAKGRRVEGASAFLKSRAEASGVLPMLYGKAHWFLSAVTDGQKTDQALFPDTGVVGVLHDGETYNVSLANKTNGRDLLIGFGIQFESVRGAISIIIEPDAKIAGKAAFEPNGHRSEILFVAGRDMNDGDLKFPWEHFQKHFRENMPEPIRKRLQAEAPKDDLSRKKKLKDKMKKWFSENKHRKRKKDDLESDLELMLLSQEVENPTKKRESKGGKGKGWTDAKKKEMKIGFKRKTKELELPKVLWVNDLGQPVTSTGTVLDKNQRIVIAGHGCNYQRDPGGRRSKSILWMNRDYERFQDLFAQYTASSETDKKDAHKIAALEGVLRDMFEEHIVCKILDAEINMKFFGFGEAEIKTCFTSVVLTFGLGGFDWLSKLGTRIRNRIGGPMSEVEELKERLAEAEAEAAAQDELAQQAIG